MIEVRDGAQTKRVQSRRLAAIVRYLVNHEARLHLDDAKQGALTVSWGGGQIHATVSNQGLPHEREPGAA